MKKEINKGLMTRKGYRFKKMLKEVKKTAITLFIGFFIGLIYYHVLINEKEVEAAETPEIAIKEEIKEEIVEEEPVEEVIEEVCFLDEISCKIKKVAEEYEIDWMMAVAISKHETGNYTSYAYESLNNVGGMMYWNGTKSALKSFNSLEEGIDAYVSNLKRNYFDMGLDTIEEIQKKYAPIGADNDPNGLNNYWVSGVSKYLSLLSK